MADRDRRDHDLAAAGLTPAKPGSATRPLPGVSAALFDEDGNEITEGTGILVLTQPWPSMLRTLYGDPDRFVKTYFERFGPRTYLVGDGARRDEDGYFWIIGRIDDVINVSGHRLSTAEIESALVAHTAVAEAAVIAISDESTGQAIVAYVTLGQDADSGPRSGGAARARRRPDRQARPAKTDHLGPRPAQDPLRQDHAPPAARHRRGPRTRGCHHPGRPLRAGPAAAGHAARAIARQREGNQDMTTATQPAGPGRRTG